MFKWEIARQVHSTMQVHISPQEKTVYLNFTYVSLLTLAMAGDAIFPEVGFPEHLGLDISLSLWDPPPHPCTDQ